LNEDLAARIASDPTYRALKGRRNALGWALTALMMLVYYGFIVLVAFDKPFLAQRLGEGVTTVGMPIGLGVIVFTIVLTAFYVRRANGEFDSLADDLVRRVKP
jgi:uncharacterized membrane protein (DUF485 family)